jgi:putative pyruvate formate lyase activating enzyme
VVASYSPHFGEESPLVGTHGSGTIFFSSCNLLCTFCQNYDISHLGQGVEVGSEQLAGMMIRLVESGCHNINFVTPTHVIPQILESLPLAIENGLNVPLVYNCGGYENTEILQQLAGIFDIYMPDFKFWEPKWADRYCQAPDYPDTAKAAIREMYHQVGHLITDEEGIASRGLLVRHLVMPSGVAGTREIMNFIAQEISTETYVNLMDQYRPCGSADQDDVINRRLSSQDYREALSQAKKAGLTRLDQRDRRRLIFGY